MNILLVEPQKTRSWGKNNQYVGLLRIATYHKKKGDNIEYVIAPKIPRAVPELIYVTSMFTYWYKSVWAAVRFYKKRYPGVKVMLGGIYATICPDHAKKSGADEVMVGQHPEAKDCPPDPSILPYPQDFAYLFTSYGCNRACTYCATHLLYGKGIQQVPPRKVIQDIKFLARKGFKKIYFGDDNLLYNSEEHINKICLELLASKMKIGSRFSQIDPVEIYIPGGMAAKDFTQKTAYLMRRAGVKEISFAIESTSDAVLKKMGRALNTNKDDLLRALEFADRAGFKREEINIYFIIGLPYQTLEDMINTLVFLIDCKVWAHPHRLTPIPHTGDWKRMGLEGWDYEALHYKDFVAPGQDNFTGDDLNTIYKIARYFNVGQRYTSGFDWIHSQERTEALFREKLRDLFPREKTLK